MREEGGKRREEKIKRSLHYSLLDGIFANIMMGMSESFIAPYAIAMKAGAGLVAILSATPNLLSSLVQVKTAQLVEKLGSRKALINRAVFVQALWWLPIIAIPYVFGPDKPAYVVIFYSIFIAINGLAIPAWSSLMADHVPETERGKVFSWRNKVFGFTGVLSMFAAGGILYLTKSSVSRFIGFTAIFLIAFVSRLISWKFLTKMYEPLLVIKEEHRFTFMNFLKRMRRSNFGRFVLFVSSMNFAVYVGAPFLTIYMLNDLKFNYMTYTVVVLAATVTGLVFMHVWGRHADDVGNLKILKLSSRFIAVIPFLWLVSPSPVYLFAVQVFAGFFWAGFNLTVTNFIYDAVTPEKRTRCVAYFNAVNGAAIFSGAVLGACLSGIIPPFEGNRILSLLLLSGIFRLFSAALSSFVKEVRKVKDISHLDLFYSIIGIRPGLRQVLFLSSNKE